MTNEFKDRTKDILEKDIEKLLPYFCVNMGVTGWNIHSEDSKFFTKAKTALNIAFKNSWLLRAYEDQQARIDELEGKFQTLAMEIYEGKHSNQQARIDELEGKFQTLAMEIYEGKHSNQQARIDELEALLNISKEAAVETAAQLTWKLLAREKVLVEALEKIAKGGELIGDSKVALLFDCKSVTIAREALQSIKDE